MATVVGRRSGDVWQREACGVGGRVRYQQCRIETVLFVEFDQSALIRSSARIDVCSAPVAGSPIPSLALPARIAQASGPGPHCVSCCHVN